MLLILLAVLLGLVLVLLLRSARSSKIRNRINSFKKNYSMIKVGMSKVELVSLMGADYTVSIENDYEILVWECKGVSPNEKNTLAKDLSGDSFAKVKLKSGLVVEYSYTN